MFMLEIVELVEWGFIVSRHVMLDGLLSNACEYDGYMDDKIKYLPRLMVMTSNVQNYTVRSNVNITVGIMF